MPDLKISRPKFPKGYADNPASYVDWEWVAAQLTEAKNYWLCSVRPPTPEAPGGRPHVVPRWGAFLDNKLFYDGSPETRHVRNILENPYVSLHLESGTQVVIMEGTSRPVERPEPEFAKRLAKAISDKYADQGYSPEPDQWNDGGLYVFRPRQCIAWTVFYENPTKFIFEPEA
ncbi:MAG: pyridoxamine 5'-phosphate oxidase [Anaerolineales bacterium]|nr:MAG: pyridoxamine 5'-phosphate oxidase [Anaerolineales bacterium]